MSMALLSIRGAGCSLRNVLVVITELGWQSKSAGLPSLRSPSPGKFRRASKHSLGREARNNPQVLPHLNLNEPAHFQSYTTLIGYNSLSSIVWYRGAARCMCAGVGQVQGRAGR